MLSLVPGKELLHNTCKNVLDRFLGKSTESESTQSQSPSQSLPSSSPTQSAPSTCAHVTSPAPASMKKSNAQLKRRIVDEIFQGTFDSGIEVSDDDQDDDDVKEVPAPISHKEHASTTGGQLNRLRKERRNSKIRVREISPSEEERRLLGDPAPHFIDPEAVSVLVPTSASRVMTFEKPRQTFTGFKPINTLKTKGNSSKQEFYMKATRKNDISPPLEKAALRTTRSRLQPQSPSQAGRIESPPPKRRRLNSADGNTDSQQSLAGHLVLSNETSNLGSSAATRRSLGEMYAMRSTERNSSRPNRVKTTPLRTLLTDHPRPNSERRVSQTSSPDELLNPKDVTDDESRFTKAARRERQATQIDSEEAIQQMKPKFKKASDIDGAQSNRSLIAASVDSNGSARHSVTPRGSRIASRLLHESPDVLQNTPEKLSRSPPLKVSHGKRFRLKQFVCEGFLNVQAYDVEVNQKGKTFSIHYRDPNIMKDAVVPPIRISKIVRINCTPDDDTTNVLMLSLSGGDLPSNKFFLDFGDSQKARAEFLLLIQSVDTTIRLTTRDRRWLSDAMIHASNTVRQQPQSQKYPEQASKQVTADPISHSYESNSHIINRERKVDRLDIGPPPTSSSVSQNISAPSQTPIHVEGAVTHNSHGQHSPPPQRVRESRHRTAKRDSDALNGMTDRINVEPRRKGSEWKRPLIYPQSGKSRATVAWDDLERLNDDEFLNDNLVSLFMRYLQEHMDTEQAKRVHFFNTFFYNSLTRASEKGNRRQINYSAVANWTKNVNLFNRDYVVVPVNEAAHWYVMIICNLRCLKDLDNEDEDVVEVLDHDQDIDNVPEDVSTPTLKSDIVEVKDSVDDNSPIDQIATDMTESAKKRPGRRKSQNFRGRRKYSTDQPIIITLDSLDQGRSATATALKSYLVEEAKDKHGIEIDKDLILGMTAKNIPLQSNFSDCGLYLCMYLEQFVRDPQTFVRSILQREEKAFPWPRRLRSSHLRQRLYDFLEELHQAQITNIEPKLSPIGRLLIKDDDFQIAKSKSVQPDLYTPSNVDAACNHYETNYSRDKKSINQGHVPLHSTSSDSATLAARSIHRDVEQQAEQVQVKNAHPIIIEDNSQDYVPAEDGTSSRYFRQKPTSRPGTVNEQSDTPQTLAERLRRERSPNKSLGPAATNQGSLAKPAKQHFPVEHDESAPWQIQKRQISISTGHPADDILYQDSTQTEQHSHPLQREGEKRSEQDEEDFLGFDDIPGETLQEHGRVVRDSSVIPDSVQGSQSDDEDPMLID